MIEEEEMSMILECSEERERPVEAQMSETSTVLQRLKEENAMLKANIGELNQAVKEAEAKAERSVPLSQSATEPLRRSRTEPAGLVKHKPSQPRAIDRSTTEPSDRSPNLPSRANRRQNSEKMSRRQ